MLKGYFSIAVCVLASMFAPYTLAQNPTPEQIQMFKSLPADQQQALASKYGISVPSASSQSTTYQNPQVIEPRPLINDSVQNGQLNQQNQQEE